MEQAGHECVGFCEFDKFAVASYTSMHLITDEQREYLATLPLKQRQKEILKSEYRNGEFYHNDITTLRADDIPAADCWCFGFPCQDISIAGKQTGFQGNRSSLFFRVMHLLGQQEEEKKPSYIFIENVKNLLSVNGGWDFARILVEMDRCGYDAEWEILNSKHFGVPQNRERIFIIGHLRGRSTTKVFPVEGTDGEDCADINIIGHREGYRRNMQVFSPDGITEALDTAGGGGRGHHTAIPIEVIGSTRPKKDNFGADRERVIGANGITPTLRGTDYKEPIKVDVPLGIIDPQGRKDRPVKPKNHAPTIRAGTHFNLPEVCIPVLTPERANKRQNGRRFKENSDVSFTLTSQDRHGVALGVDIDSTEEHPGMYVDLNGVTAYAAWYPKYECYIVIRKLTPLECFRLQSFSDDYFYKAQFVNSDSQLYRQIGNSVTVKIIYEIGRRMKC